MQYAFSVWSNVYDNAVKSLGPGDWTWVLEQLKQHTETDDKYSALLFNLARFDATAKRTGLLVEDKVIGGLHDQRVGANITEVTGLVIDYDNETLLQNLWTIDEVADRFSSYTFLIYSSHSYWANYPPIERFRLVLPFKQPMLIGSLESDWNPFVPAIKQFIGYEEPQDLPEEMWYPNEETGVTVKRDKSSIDKQSFNPVQGYFLPTCPVGRHVVYRQNDGVFLDPATFERTELKDYSITSTEIPADAERGGDGAVIRETFDVLAWLKANALYIKPLAAGKHQIICPWHQEHTKAIKSGAVLLPAHNSPLPNIYCQHNHTVSTWKLIKEMGDEAIRPYCVTTSKVDFEEQFLKSLSRHRERVVEPAGTKKRIVLHEVLPRIVDVPARPFSREERSELIRKKCLNKKHDMMLLYAFEGFGKSYYAYLEVMERKSKVLFASLSNEQASEQASSFRELGLKVQLIPGREYLLRTKYNVEIQYQGASHPWDTERVAENATKQWMRDVQKRTDEDIEEIWRSTEAPKPDWVNNDIVCTTIARTMAYGRMQMEHLLALYKSTPTQGVHFAGMKRISDEHRIVPKGTVVFFDDPDKEFFTWYKPYNPKFLEKAKERRKREFERRGPIHVVKDGVAKEWDYSDPKLIRIDNKVVQVETINKREYFVRPEHLTLGYALVDTRLVFTTTEELTRNLIKNMYPGVYEPKLMPDDKMLAGDIAMIKTNIVSAKRDGFLPPIMQRLHREGYTFHYIADGQGAAINLVNSKGQNLFAEENTVIEISEPHYGVVTRFIDELHAHGWTESDRNAMKVILALDALQQAIGRNSGYRWSDRINEERRQCVVLCEPKLFDSLVYAMRYHVETIVASVDDRIGMKKEYEGLIDGICWYIRNLDSYLKNGIGRRGQAFWDDVSSVLKELPANRKPAFKKRLGVALKEKIKVTKDVALAQKLGNYVDMIGA